MNKFYKSLPWPKLSKNFDYFIDEVFLDKKFIAAHPFPDYPYYRQYKINDNTLYETLQPFFNFNIKDRIFCQIVKKGLGIHKDVGRKIIYNYILETGGENVYTTFYDEDKKSEMFSINIPEQQWHLLDVSFFHGVSGIENDRYAISIYESLRC
jgi:hypothetical protein